MTTSEPHSQENYTVVARRFRPKNFAELVGQGGIAKALQNAIDQNRVGHAYLFTGARGVGKTSSARIFAKMLNCEQGPTPSPCDQCEACRAIAAGSDVDVIEIDGASNRGIDEIRQLRSNVSVRPSRSKSKIYIIDEVHMLTGAAFNALLKTLEEPPGHVKFIFCTTDPEKIPITVLSRCQRFDFAPVTIDAIADRLRYILDSEKIEADDDAIRLISRRAAGSVRDSQSLLEQLISFSTGRISIDTVHELLGTVRGGRILECIQAIQNRDAASALRCLDEAILEGVDVGQMAEQLLGTLRDSMALVVGCPPESAVHTDPSDSSDLQAFGASVGLQNLLAMAQMVDQSLSRMRFSTEPRILLEIVLIRLCALDDLSGISDLINQLGQLAPAHEQSTAPSQPTRPRQPAPPKPTNLPGVSAPAGTTAAPNNPVQAASPNPPQDTSNSVREEVNSAREEENSDVSKKNVQNEQPASPVAPESTGTQTKGSIVDSAQAINLWKQAVDMFEDTTAVIAKTFTRVAISGPNSLVVTLDSAYNKEVCERPERKTRIESTLSDVAGCRIRVDFKADMQPVKKPLERAPARTSIQQRIRQVERHPFVSEAMKTLEAEIEDVKFPPTPPANPK